MADLRRSSAPNLSAIQLLGAMCGEGDTLLAQQADKALYQQIIIPLCDDFTSRNVRNVNLILAQLIHQSARLGDPQIQQVLREEGLTEPAQFIERLQRIQTDIGLSSKRQQQIKKICILSRVTIGADVSITSIILQRLHRQLPHTAITLIGPNHLPRLFQHPFLSHKLYTYKRDQAQYQGFGHWLKLRAIIKEEQGELTEEAFLLIDPDSRLSQLGLLPLAPEQACKVLPSRMDNPTDQSLTTICNRWLDQLLGASDHLFPAISTNPQSAPHTLYTVVVNFGVGNDPNKRISLEFEQELLTALLQQKQTQVLLDSGKGIQEQTQSQALEDAVRRQWPEPEKDLHFKRIEQDIDGLALEIQNADLFIGYDSCSGHIAAALHTPTIICFKGAPNPRFYARWQPVSSGGSVCSIQVPQKPLADGERSLLIQRIIDIASSHSTTFT